MSVVTSREVIVQTHLIVQVPSVIEIVDFSILTVATTRLACISEIATKSLSERDLSKSLRTLYSDTNELAIERQKVREGERSHLFKHIVKRFQRCEHRFDIVISVE